MTRYPRLFAVLSTLLTWLFLTFSAQAQVEWTKLGEDLDKAELSFSTGLFSSSSISLFKTSLSRYRLGIVRAFEFGWKRVAVKSLCRASKAVMCINGSFFDEQGKPLGLLISRGMLHQKMHRGGDTLTGVLVVTGSKAFIVHRDAFVAKGAIEALQAGPRLLADGEAVPGVKDTFFGSNLSGLCITGNNEAIVYRVTSGMLGGSLKELQELLLTPEIGCKDAINFDGGGSSEVYVSDQIPGATAENSELQLPGEDPVPVALGLFLRDSRGS